jgi:hypothetical protein
MLMTRRTVPVTQLDHLGGNTEPGDEDRRASLDDSLHLHRHVARHGGEEIDAEGLGRERTHLTHLLDHAGGGHGRCAQTSEAAGFGHGGDEAVVGHPAHAGQHDGVLDLEHLGESCAH